MRLYTPRPNREDGLDVLHAFVRAHPLATLVSTHAGTPVVSHLPLLLDPARGPRGTLFGHVARANEHWRALEAAPETVAVFHGPGAYVSSTWYEPPTSIPTWNYAVVHARGRARLVHDPEALRAHVHALTRVYEPPATLEDPGYADAKLRAIVGIEIEVASFDGKFKLSQNRSEGDQARVAARLGASACDGDRATAALMEARRAR